MQIQRMGVLVGGESGERAERQAVPDVLLSWSRPAAPPSCPPNSCFLAPGVVALAWPNDENDIYDPQYEISMDAYERLSNTTGACMPPACLIRGGPGGTEPGRHATAWQR